MESEGFGRWRKRNIRNTSLGCHSSTGTWIGRVVQIQGSHEAKSLQTMNWEPEGQISALPLRNLPLLILPLCSLIPSSNNMRLSDVIQL